MNRCKRNVTKSWRLNQTYIKVAEKDRFLHRVVNKQGNTMDFYLPKEE